MRNIHRLSLASRDESDATSVATGPAHARHRTALRRNHPFYAELSPGEDLFYLPWWDFYFKSEEVAEAFLDVGYDHIFYVTRGGMSVAHRLAHVLGMPSGGMQMSPMYIRRHTSDAIQARRMTPRLEQPVKPEQVRGQRILLVEDTIGSGETLLCALDELYRHSPSAVDVVTVGLDHAECLLSPTPMLRKLIANVVVCFDYWGWMVLPWERQAADAPLDVYTNHAVPYSLKSQAEKRQIWQTCDGYSRTNDVYEIRWQQDFAPHVLALAKSVSTIMELTPGRTQPWLAGKLGSYDRFLPLGKESPAGLYTCPAATVDLVLARNVLPSQLGVCGWDELVVGAHHALRRDGYLVFDYLSRVQIATRFDVRTDRDYFTPQLLDKYMARCGFVPVYHSSPHSSPQSVVALACYRRA